MSRPRTLVLTFNHFELDTRARRNVAALSQIAEVVTCGKGEPPPGATEHLRIPDDLDHLPTTPRGLAALAMRRTDLAYHQTPAASAAHDLLQGVEVDLLLATNVLTLPPALDVAQGRPVIVDMYEYAPREMEENWQWRLMVQPFVTDLCRQYLPRADAVVTVAPGIAREYAREFGVDAVTITNASAFHDPSPRPVDGVIRAVHGGMATPNRHLENTILAAAGVPGLTLDLYLVPSPRARRHLKYLHSLAAGIDNVRILDPVPVDRIAETLDPYDLGVYVLYPNSFNYLHILPTKFFEYVQSGLGVLIGPSPEMAALAREHRLGQILPDFSQETLAAALAQLSPDEVFRWKQASCRAARSLSSEAQAARLVELVLSLLGARGVQA
jgi:hypothetical protein